MVTTVHTLSSKMWIIWPGTVISTIDFVHLVILLLPSSDTFRLFVLIGHSWSIRDLYNSFSAWKRPAMFLMDLGYY